MLSAHSIWGHRFRPSGIGRGHVDLVLHRIGHRIYNKALGWGIAGALIFAGLSSALAWLGFQFAVSSGGLLCWALLGF